MPHGPSAAVTAMPSADDRGGDQADEGRQRDLVQQLTIVVDEIRDA